jgi:prevent-host-death family protein
MKKSVWQLQSAKNSFSALVNKAAKGEPQLVTKNNIPIVYVIDVHTYNRKIALKKKSKKSVLLSRPYKEVAINTERDKDNGRDVSL